MITFECTYNVVREYRDDNGYPSSDCETDTLVEESLDRIYERMAVIKIYHESRETSYGSFSVDFGPIREIEEINVHDVSKSTLENTETWKCHVAKLEAERIKREQNEAERIRLFAIEKEFHERTELKRLQEKYQQD